MMRVFICSCLMFAAWTTGHAQSTKNTVDGTVFGSDGSKIGGVKITIYVASQVTDKGVAPIATAETNGDGYYSIEEPKANDPYDMVYTHSKYECAIVTRLADKDKQHISKILYRKGEQKDNRTLSSMDEKAATAMRTVFLASHLEDVKVRRDFIESTLGGVSDFFWEFSRDKPSVDMLSEKLLSVCKESETKLPDKVRRNVSVNVSRHLLTAYNAIVLAGNEGRPFEK